MSVQNHDVQIVNTLQIVLIGDPGLTFGEVKHNATPWMREVADRWALEHGLTITFEDVSGREPHGNIQCARVVFKYEGKRL